MAGLSADCVRHHDKHYWAWNDPGFWAGSRCTASPQAAGPHIRVRVSDTVGFALPGAKVQAIQSESVKSEELESDEKGEVEIPVSPGRWRVHVVLPGFRPATYDLEVGAGSDCRVCFELDLADSSVETVV